MPRATTQILDPECVISKTAAKELYGLAPAELQQIKPVRSVSNHHGGRYDIEDFHESDVAALAARLQPTASPKRTPTRTRVRNITRTNAIKDFGLKACQMDRLVPVHTLPNKHDARYPMRLYDLEEVEALATLTGSSPKKSQAGRTPTGAKTPTNVSPVKKEKPSPTRSPSNRDPVKTEEQPLGEIDRKLAELPAKAVAGDARNSSMVTRE